MGSLGLTAEVLLRLAGVKERPEGFVAWADGLGGAWRYDRALWIRERCDFLGEAIVHATERTSAADGAWAARAATPAERSAFLDPLPGWRGIVVGHTAKGLPVAIEEGRQERSTRVIRGAIQARLFERVQGRIVNGEILAQSIHGSALAGEMRSQFDRGLELPGRMRNVSPVYRSAFDIARGLAVPAFGGSLSERIETALANASARLVDWRPLPESEVSIVWSPLLGALAGQLVESRACALTLGLLSAGICVEGADAAFDITSLASAVARQPRAGSHGSGRGSYAVHHE